MDEDIILPLIVVIVVILILAVVIAGSDIYDMTFGLTEASRQAASDKYYGERRYLLLMLGLIAVGCLFVLIGMGYRII